MKAKLRKDMKFNLLEDIVIPKGLTFETMDGTNIQLCNGSVGRTIGLNGDTIGTIICEFDDEYFEEINEEYDFDEALKMLNEGKMMKSIESDVIYKVDNSGYGLNEITSNPKTGNLEPIRDGGYNRALAFVEINSKWVEVKQ